MSFRQPVVKSFLLMSLVTAATVSSPAAPLAWELPEINDDIVRQRCDRLYLSIQRLTSHLLEDVHPWEEDSQLLLMTQSRSGEHTIRPNTNMVAGMAFLYRFGPYDTGIMKLTRAELLDRKIVPMMRYLTTTHVTGSRPTSDGKPWGDAWQSALWTNELGLAAWWVGDDLPDDLAAEIRRVVAHEADRFVDVEPPHQIRNDTKAEENAWNSTVLSTAILLMPDDPRRPSWEKTFQRWALSAFLRPADERSTTVVDGRTVAEQFTGANIHDDYTLENHHRVHPDYMSTFSITMGCSNHFLMTQRRPPEALQYNAAGIYENLKWFTLPDGGFIYPSGQDWALYRNVDWLYAHVVMAAIGNDPEAWPLIDRCLEVLEKMQARTDSGTIYLPGENFFASAQSDKLKQYAKAWLALHFTEKTETADPDRRGVRRLDAGKIIINRTPNAVHAFSWGSRVMAQCIPMTVDRLISPHERSGVGHIRIKGQEKVPGVSLVESQIQDTPDAFTVEVILDHGQAIRAHLQFRSQPDGTWTVREKLVALSEVTTSEVATGLIGILNDRHWIYQQGRRRVAFDRQQHTIESGSGEQLQPADVRRINIDDSLLVTSEQPLRVHYRAASKPHRGRATDELYLNVIAGEQHWEAGQTLSEYEATIRCPEKRQEPEQNGARSDTADG